MMRYFMFSPIDMNEQEAYSRAINHLEDEHIIHVMPHAIKIVPPVAGMRPAAAPNTYLVRVEQDGSLRVVQKGFVN